MIKITPEKAKFIYENYNKIPSVEMAKILNVTHITIHNWARKKGLRRRDRSHFSEESIEKIISLLKEGNRLVDIAKIMSITIPKLLRTLEFHKIDYRSYYTYEMNVRHKIKKDSGINALYNTYKNNSLAKNVIFDLKKDEFFELISMNCYYCDQPPSKIAKAVSMLTASKYNGIDKMYPQLGYVIGNCVPCCWECNRIKSNIPYNLFIEKIEKINNKLKQRLK